MPPIIGLLAAVDGEATTSIFRPYVHAIEVSGGMPLLLPYTENESVIRRFVGLCDGLFFTGGMDIVPARYGEQTSACCDETQPLRDALEFAVFNEAFPTGKPLLGICRGAQLINVALGGTLYQDLPSERPSPIAHRQSEGKFEFSHDITVLPDTPLHALLGTAHVRGNSFHHQAVKTLGEGLAVMATADDGVIEGLWAVDHPYLRAYQWHPERLYDKDENSRVLFQDFISVCAKGARS